jgi:hypothetical protein
MGDDTMDGYLYNVRMDEGRGGVSPVYDTLDKAREFLKAIEKLHPDVEFAIYKWSAVKGEEVEVSYEFS